MADFKNKKKKDDSFFHEFFLMKKALPFCQFPMVLVLG